MVAVTGCSDFGAQEKKNCYCFHFFPFCLIWSDGTICCDLSIWMMSFKPDFSLSSFTLKKRLFSSTSLYAIRVVSSAYVRLLVFLLAILIPACDSSNPVFHMMYSAYNLNKQGDSIQPWCIPFPILNQFVVLPGASTGVPTHDKGHAERPDMQRRVRAQGAPLDLPEHLPQNKNLPVLLFHDFHQLFWH